MLRILGRSTAINVIKVLWCVEELGLPFQREDYGGPFGKIKEQPYLSLNPNGRVPTVIEDDGFVMWESSAINLYLAEKYASPLWPATPQGRGRMLQWAFFIEIGRAHV